eukprot:CAMPEP_0197433642 /NCGR_PEP_ID=MMETSP1175-20131217/1511_1 /TAXON_ID=1003142 /ORGANISM="Triceratium dubium, Strain CCMP147" /LENGTH=1363 /DNA_ID=CAMNT_0042962103 /DNA_START=42 /DNA_END=4133 /DNA_ORIENTATION=+
MENAATSSARRAANTAADKPRIIPANAAGPTSSSASSTGRFGGSGSEEFGSGTGAVIALGELRFSLLENRLYGRESELVALKAAYDRIRRKGSDHDARESSHCTDESTNKPSSSRPLPTRISRSLGFALENRQVVGGPSSSLFSKVKRFDLSPRIKESFKVSPARTEGLSKISTDTDRNDTASTLPPVLRRATHVASRNGPNRHLLPRLRRNKTDEGCRGTESILPVCQGEIPANREEERRYGGAELVLLRGYSGVGKSALAHALRDEIAARNEKLRARKRQRAQVVDLDPEDAPEGAIPSVEAFFVEGKFDTQRRAIPYSAFSAAFGQLFSAVESLRADSPQEFFELQDRIRSAIRKDACRDIADLMPGILNILSKNIDDIDSMNDEETLQETTRDIGGEWLPSCEELPADDNSPLTSSTTMGARVRRGTMLRTQSHFVLRHIIQAVCSPARPTIFFLDDLQNADHSSLELLEALMTSMDIQGLLIIGSYLSNEVDNQQAHPLAKRLQDIEHHGNKASYISRLDIDNLTLDAVNDFISDVLSADPMQTLELAEVVHRRTHGNIFFVKQLLVTLKEEGLLSYSIGALKWTWTDVGEIESTCCASDNVVEHLLERRLKRNLLPSSIRVLAAASCLGASFTASDVTVAVEALRGSTEMCSALIPRENSGKSMMNRATEEQVSGTKNIDILNQFVDQGLLEPVRRESERYRFVHDQVQNAAFSFIPAESRDELQTLIGSALVHHYSTELGSLLFVAVDLCNCGARSIGSAKEKMKLAGLNLRAAKKALASSSFSLAGHYAGTGIDLMDDKTCWDKYCVLTINLHKVAVEAYYCQGELDRMQKYADRITARVDIPFHDKVDVYATLVNSLFRLGRPSDAVDLADSVLRNILGRRFVPKRHLKLASLASVVKTKRLLQCQSRESLESLPAIKCEKVLNALLIIDSLCENAVHLLSHHELNLVLRLKSLRWTIRHGTSSFAPVALMFYSAVLCGHLGGYKEALKYGEIAESLAEEYPYTFAKTCLMSLLFVKHWSAPLHCCLKPALDAYQIGMESGSLHTAVNSCNIFCHYALWTGKPLSLVNADFQAYVEQAIENKLEIFSRVMLPSWQLVQNLMGRNSDPSAMSGEVMVEAELRQSTSGGGHLHHLIDFSKMWLLFYFEEHELAWNVIEEGSDFDKVCAGQHIICRRAFCAALVAFALAHKTKKPKWKRRAIKVVKQMSSWCEVGNVNCVHMLHLLEAESAALSGAKDRGQIREKFNRAITTAGRHGFPQDKALANERAGLFFLSIGNDYWAGHYLTEAHKGYLDWEAFSKASQLTIKYADYIPAIESSKLGMVPGVAPRAMPFSYGTCPKGSKQCTNLISKMACAA